MVHVTWAVCSGHCSVDSLNPFRHFKWIGWSNSYCWWKISCTTWLVWRTVNNGIFTISTGAGFLPSSVTHSWRLKLWKVRFVSSYSRLSIHGGQETDSWKVGDWFPNPRNSSSKPLAKLLQPMMSFWTLDEVWISSIVQILTLTSISFFSWGPLYRDFLVVRNRWNCHAGWEKPCVSRRAIDGLFVGLARWRIWLVIAVGSQEQQQQQQQQQQRQQQQQQHQQQQQPPPPPTTTTTTTTTTNNNQQQPTTNKQQTTDNKQQTNKPTSQQTNK